MLILNPIVIDDKSKDVNLLETNVVYLALQFLLFFLLSKLARHITVPTRQLIQEEHQFLQRCTEYDPDNLENVGNASRHWFYKGITFKILKHLQIKRCTKLHSSKQHALFTHHDILTVSYTHLTLPTNREV